MAEKDQEYHNGPNLIDSAKLVLIYQGESVGLCDASFMTGSDNVVSNHPTRQEMISPAINHLSTKYVAGGAPPSKLTSNYTPGIAVSEEQSGDL